VRLSKPISKKFEREYRCGIGVNGYVAATGDTHAQ
jgi:hypothetical protein